MDTVKQGMDRREFLAIAGVTTASLYLAGCGFSSTPQAPTEIQVLRFLNVSSILTGFGGDLPRDPAPAYFTALSALGLQCTPADFLDAAYGPYGAPLSMDDLRTRGALALPGADEFVRQVNGAWWSGIVPTPDGGLEVVTFEDALAFTVVHPATECLGTVGSWSGPGEGMA